MKHGIVMLIVISLILIAGTFAPSIHAEAYDRYVLVDSWVSGNTKTCLYENIRKEQKTKSVSKSRSCQRVY